MSDRAMPCPWPLSDGTIGDRIVFNHSPILHHEADKSTQQEVLDVVRPGQVRSSTGVNSSSSGGGGGGGSGSGSGSGGSSSFAMVNVLSEPLEANISASLVFTPNAQPAAGSRREAGGGGGGDGMRGGIAPDSAEESQSENGPAVILGPVVGRVEVVAQSGVVRESCCVPVLLEVDREGEVACVVSF